MKYEAPKTTVIDLLLEESILAASMELNIDNTTSSVFDKDDEGTEVINAKQHGFGDDSVWD
jgi:hypothetical protein